MVRFPFSLILLIKYLSKFQHAEKSKQNIVPSHQKCEELDCLYKRRQQ